MSKIKQIVTTILSTIFIITSIVSPLSAAVKDNNEIVLPMYTNVNDVDVQLSKVSGKIVITIRVRGYSGTTYSAGEIALFRTTSSGKERIKYWDRKNSSSNTFTFTDSSTTATTGTYEVTLFIKSTRNSVGETITGSDTLTVN